MSIDAVKISAWRDMINSGDRAGFYYEYYKETGQYQALIQASITSYSGALGGMALLGNYLAKIDDEKNYQLTLDDFSRDIALATLNGIEGDIASGMCFLSCLRLGISGH